MYSPAPWSRALSKLGRRRHGKRVGRRGAQARPPNRRDGSPRGSPPRATHRSSGQAGVAAIAESPTPITVGRRAGYVAHCEDRRGDLRALHCASQCGAQARGRAHRARAGATSSIRRRRGWMDVPKGGAHVGHSQTPKASRWKSGEGGLHIYAVGEHRWRRLTGHEHWVHAYQCGHSACVWRARQIVVMVCGVCGR